MTLQRLLDKPALAHLEIRLGEPLPLGHLNLFLGCGNHGNHSLLPGWHQRCVELLLMKCLWFFYNLAGRTGPLPSLPVVPDALEGGLLRALLPSQVLCSGDLRGDD